MRILTVLSILVLMNVASANVVCKKEGRYWYPANAKAISIAKALRVKTCNGKRFKAVLRDAGLKSNVTNTAKRMTVKELVASLKAK